MEALPEIAPETTETEMPSPSAKAGGLGMNFVGRFFSIMLDRFWTDGLCLGLWFWGSVLIFLHV